MVVDVLRMLLGLASVVFSTVAICAISGLKQTQHP